MPEKPKPEASPKAAEKQPLTHEELVAAAVAELIEEEGENRKPPAWFQRVFDNT